MANGHIAALNKKDELKGFHEFNLGTGKGTSVYELVKAFEEASGHEIKMVVHPRRQGDVAQLLAIPDKANKILEWEAKKTIKDACLSVRHWIESGFKQNYF